MMNFIIKNIKWIMLLSGVLTMTMFYGLFAPEAALESMFGTSFNGTLENIVMRSWSALVGLIGVILIYGFFSQKNRVFSISIAAFSKLIFVTLVLLYGQEFLGTIAPAIAMDSVVIILSGVYLFAVYMQRKISLVNVRQGYNTST
jgi:hypothetical protein